MLSEPKLVIPDEPQSADPVQVEESTVTPAPQLQAVLPEGSGTPMQNGPKKRPLEVGTIEGGLMGGEPGENRKKKRKKGNKN